MYGYIYETTNLINGKKYIGKHKSEVFNPEYKGSGKILWRAINKYGWDNFRTVILKECESLDELNQCEIEEIKSRNAVHSSDYYNINGGGEGWQAPWESPSFREKMKNLMTGDNNPAKQESVRSKMRGSRPSMKGSNNPNYKGKSVTDYQRKVLSEMCSTRYLGKGNPMYGRRGDKSPHYGKIHVNNGVNFITIPKEKFEEYQSKGYVKTKNPGTKGRVYLNNGVNSILINNEDVELYENLGWTRGKKNCPILRNLKDHRLSKV